MFSIRVERFHDLDVVECKGRLTLSDAMLKLRDSMQMEDDARVIAIDLSEVEAIGGGGLGMLVYLERWAHENQIQLKLFCPSERVMEALAPYRSMAKFEIANIQEMIGLLAEYDYPQSLAA
ncbi:MAG TPA: STAS domain-containing protein [Terriglobales bacterium]|nr:STAS domain-containing protein [Terriglobales bacterium]